MKSIVEKNTKLEDSFKMMTRRNWLLRCSVAVNVVVLLYVAILQDGGGGSGSVGSEPKQNGRLLSSYIYQTLNSVDNSDIIKTNLEASKPIVEPSKVYLDTVTNCPTLNMDLSSNISTFKEQKMLLASTVTVSHTESFSEDTTLVEQGENAMADLSARVRQLVKCHDREYEPRTEQRGDFWVLKNYVRASHGPLGCSDSITYTTHADYTFLDNLVPLLERWQGPVSIALHTPGTDFAPTLATIRYLRDCLPGSELVRQFTTFHVYFSSKHIPKQIPKPDQAVSESSSFNCSLQPPFYNVTSSQLYKSQKKLLYPVNVGRNVAREAALTHFILPSDIELYPSPDLIRKFLEMIAKNEGPLQRKNPKVFPLSIFEVGDGIKVPNDKTTLTSLLKSGGAIPFHKRLCSSCHKVPKANEWVKANETEDLGIFTVGKRIGKFIQWEPIFIGTHSDPLYDERLSWEGKKDKMPQGYALCVMDYDFQILDNAFLVHKPGIKTMKKDPRRALLSAKTNQQIKRIIYPELKVLFGVRKGCAV